MDTDTGERLYAYLFVAVLPYSGYAEAFPGMKQESWITGHVNAYRYFGGVTRILTPDNLKTGVLKNSQAETVLNKSYQGMAEHYGTAILPARPRSPKDKAFVEGSVSVVSRDAEHIRDDDWKCGIHRWVKSCIESCRRICLTRRR